MKNFDNANLSQQLGYALHWTNADIELRQQAIDALKQLGPNGKTEDLPKELQNLLKKASQIAANNKP